MKQVTADEVRYYVNKHYVEPARKVGQGQVTLRAGHIHTAMMLTSRMPLVCEVLDGKKFEDYSRVKRLARKGPKQGANVWFTFDILP